MERIRLPELTPRTLSDEQVAKLVETIAQQAHTFAGGRDLALVALLLDTGLRISEALSLTLNDIDLEQGFVYVMGKGSRGRSVPISNTCRLILAKYIARRKLVICATNKVFITTLAITLSRYRAAERLRQYAKQAGITGVRVSPHSLRFTFVRKWLQTRGDSLVLQKILGHSSPATTAYYARLFSTDLKGLPKSNAELVVEEKRH